MTSSYSLEGLKKACEMHVERMHKSESPTHPASGDGFILSALEWAIKELERCANR